jgi:hypothetical protein
MCACVQDFGAGLWLTNGAVGCPADASLPRTDVPCAKRALMTADVPVRRRRHETERRRIVATSKDVGFTCLDRSRPH